ncbi:MAG: hypothetical protein H0W73_13790 [Bacteroidetes bacterium]|nr:hypothetical protein [Bacteroidota bacterium]
MKRISLLLYALILITGEFKAQTDSINKPKKWSRELAINIYGLSITGGDYYTNYERTANNYAFSGLNMKFYNKKNAVRASFDYLQQIIANRRLYRTPNNLISSRGVQLSVGYQRMLGKKNPGLYVFTDLSYKHANDIRTMPSYYPYWDYYYGNTLSRITSVVYAVSPGIGIHIKLKKNIMLTLESAAQFYYSTERSTEISGKYKIKGIAAKPLNCAFGFKF